MDEDNNQLNEDIQVSIVNNDDNNSHKVELQRDGWNLIAICRDINTSDIDMTNIQEIQAQNGDSVYTGEWANYSNLDRLEAGYGYWVKGDRGTRFDVGITNTTLTVPLKRDSWNLMASCSERATDLLDMTNITEIQAQNGDSLYTGDWAEYSTLDTLLNGYGYWVRGDKESLFNVN